MKSSKEWEAQLTELRAKRITLEGTAAEAKAIRAATALDAEMGDPKARKQLAAATETLRFSELSLETTSAAITAAEGKLAEAEQAEAAANEHQRSAEIKTLAEQRLAISAEIDAGLVALKPAVEKYRVLGEQIKKLAGEKSHQLIANWRLEAATDAAFSIGGTGHALRKSLTEHEALLLRRYIETTAGDKAA